MLSQDQRVEQAWQKSQDWIVRYHDDEPANVTVFPRVDIDGIPKALQEIAQHFPSFSIEPLWRSHTDSSFKDGDTIAKLFPLFLSGAINLVVSYELFKNCDCLRMEVRKKTDQDAEVELTWWSDVAIPLGENIKERASLLLHHFLWLQAIFKSDEVLMARANDLPYVNDIWMHL